MTLSQNAFVNLVTVLSASPSGNHRAAASAILGGDLVARWTRRYQAAPGHPAFRDRGTFVQGNETLAQLLTQSKPADESTDAALFFVHHDRTPTGLHHLTDEAARPPNSAAVQSRCIALATELAALVSASMGASAFSAAREPYLAHLTSWATVNPYGYYGAAASAEPGESFRLQGRYHQWPDFKLAPPELDETRRGAGVRAAGSYFMNLRAAGRSLSTASSATVSVDLCIDDDVIASYSSPPRGSSNTGDCVELGDHRLFFNAGQADAHDLDLASVVSVRNSGSSMQWLGGFLAIWPTP